MNSANFSTAATIDLRRIWSEIAKDSEINADRMVDRLIDVCRLLAGNPHLGAVWSERHLPIRCFPVPGNKYVVFFTPKSDGVEIIRIIHGRRNLERIMPLM